jgi:two-component system chemotaxis sensor kinase CheA
MRALLHRVATVHSDKNTPDEHTLALFAQLQSTILDCGGTPTVLPEALRWSAPAASSGIDPAALMEERLSVASNSLSNTHPADDELFAFVNTDLVQKYITEALDLLAQAELACLRFEQSPNDDELVDIMFGAMHSIKGNSGFMGFADIEGMATDLENVLDALRYHEVEVYPGLVSLILSNMDILRRAIQDADKPPQAVSFLAPDIFHRTEHSQTITSAAASAYADQISVPELFGRPAPKQGGILKPKTPSSAKPRTQLDTQFDTQQPHPHQNEQQNPSNNNHEHSEHQKAYEGQEQTQQTPNTPSSAHSQKSSADTIQPQAAQAQPFTPVQRKDIRVDTAKLDALFDLVGELITIEAMVTRHPELEGLDLPHFAKSASMLNKITRELQEVTTSIRMTPLEGLFTKMKRLVRDLALRLNKPASLLIAGAETEMDKNVIEELADPLMHLIRNALDHGIEPSADERRQAGKPEHATLRLEARYEGSEILIILADDGRGLDRQRILAKAAEQHLLKAQHAELYRSGRADAIADRDVWSYIFEPGFSTAERLSDISGRGVGMDVVRKNIEKLQGSISLHSSAGRGTTFTLRIPLTLAIIDGMLLRVGHADKQTIYALPILTIRESFRPTREQIHRTMDALEMLNVRGEVYPVIRLHELFGKEPQTRHLHEGIVIMAEAVVQGEPRRVCVFVDEIVGQQQIVVKGLSDYIGSVDGITGCMILSNGEIGLILDLEAIIRKAERSAQKPNHSNQHSGRTAPHSS